MTKIVRAQFRTLRSTFMEFGENLRNFGANTKEYQNLVVRDSIVILAKIVPLIHQNGLILYTQKLKLTG